MSVSAASIYNADIDMQDHASSLAKPDSHAAVRPSVEITLLYSTAYLALSSSLDPP